ncbi:hypothetical protein [Paracoccus albus]|uniref:hypothetical protein n=1 Tax=Paracoccus albus TaxID=3017784 RepID=UPI0022F0083E|nr:hypothetical protein [Paracoccus albus]WBU60647.1 hypothetical protein PAF20_01605 [Paracoccus albus]
MDYLKFYDPRKTIPFKIRHFIDASTAPEAGENLAGIANNCGGKGVLATHEPDCRGCS